MPCTEEKVVDYLTEKEKRNLARMYLLLKESEETAHHLLRLSRIDSGYIAQLQNSAQQLQQVIEGYKAANGLYKEGYSQQEKAIRALRKQLRRTKLRSALAGVAGSVAAFGTGAAITYLLLTAK